MDNHSMCDKLNASLTGCTPSVPSTAAASAIIASDTLFEGYPPGLLMFASAACIVYIMVGVPGNLITIIALARCKKVRNATAVFIINLSLADLLFCCFNLPLATSTFWFNTWIHGDLLCRLFPLLRYGLSAVSLFTVLAITLNRYVMIGHPRVYPKIYRYKYLGLMVAATWLCAFGALIPTWRGTWGVFGMDLSIGSCSIIPDSNNASPKDIFFVMAFVVPCLAIIVCYARIFYIVRKTAMRSHEPMMAHRKPNTVSITPMPTITNCLLQKNNNVVVAAAHRLAKDNAQHRSTHPQQSRNKPYEHDGVSGSSEHSSSTATCQTQPMSQYESKVLLKFIDSSVDSDRLPDVQRAGKRVVDDRLERRKLSAVSVGKNVEFRNDVHGGLDDGPNGDAELSASQNLSQCSSALSGTRVGKKRRRKDTDSAVEESTSSSENNQIYHIRNESNCTTLVSVQVEPSSSSGIDLPLDEEIVPSRLRRSVASSLRRLRRSKNRRTDVENTLGASGRKHSTINSSGASIVYPGRMSNKDRRLLKMIMVILLSFIVCYLPITLSKVFKSIQDNSYLNIMGYLLIYLTTCINPIIYVVMSSEYRQAYWNLLMCRLTSASSRRSNYNNPNKHHHVQVHNT